MYGCGIYSGGCETAVTPEPTSAGDAFDGRYFHLEYLSDDDEAAIALVLALT